METATAEQPASVDDAFMQRYFQAFRNKDLTALEAMVTDDVVLESAFGPEAHGKRFVGKKGFIEATLRYFETLPGVHSFDRTWTVFGDKAFTEFTVSYEGPDGKPVTVRVCDLFDFRDGKIASKRAYSKRLSQGAAA